MTKGSRLFGSARLGMSLVSFLGCLCIYTLRNDVSFAIVCMVNSTAVEELDGSSAGSTGSQCKPNNNTGDSGSSIEGSLIWSKGQQGTVLSAFFWGYIFSQILGGYIAGRYGGKMIVFASVFTSALLNLISPVCANAHLGAFIAIRVALGVVQGAMFPALHAMWALWAPPLERSLLTGICYAGAQIGNTIVMPISGVLCEYGFAGGWPSVYYVFGIIGMAWCILWLIYAANSPAEHRFISRSEREYIEGTMMETLTKKGEKAPPVPWKSMMMSIPVWGLLAGHFAGDWGAYIMSTGLPLFMNDILGFELSSMGFLSAIPYLVYFVSINVAGIIADAVRNAGWLSTINVRRLAMTIALGSQAVFLVACGFLGCGQESLVIVFLTLGIGLSGVSYAGFVVNYLDIAPTFAGTLLGIGNSISCIAGILCPLIIGWMTPKGTQDEWLVVLWITFGILLAGALLFIIFAAGEVQEWAKVRSDTIKSVDTGILPLEIGSGEDGKKANGSSMAYDNECGPTDNDSVSKQK